MTPKEQKTLTQTIQANRRLLALLDQRIDDLTKTFPSVLDEYDIDDRQPFFYGAVGADGQLGIPVSSTANLGENPAFGYVRGHTDSAFVLTGINVAVQVGATCVSVQSPSRPSLMLGLRIYDESSSKWITFTNQNNLPQQNAKFPADAFSAFSAYNQGGFSMSTECVFPRSFVLRVEAYMQNSAGITLPRLQVVFCGYKVYGG